MNTRALSEGHKVIPARSRKTAMQTQSTAEDIAFDKADDAASLEKIRTAIEQTESAMTALEEAAEAVDPDKVEALKEKKLRLIEELKVAEEAIRERELAEKSSDDS
jgi:hypothetical protein